MPRHSPNRIVPEVELHRHLGLQPQTTSPRLNYDQLQDWLTTCLQVRDLILPNSAALLYQIRRGLGLNQTQAARYIGLKGASSRMEIGKIEQGKRVLTLDQMIYILEKLIEAKEASS